MEDALLYNLSVIRKRIKVTCNRCGRNPDDVKLLLATKTVAAEKIEIVLKAGENIIGENKVQELKSKYEFLKTTDAAIHFIGHLQTNKVKDVLKYTNCIQSIDRMGLVYALDKQLQALGKSMDILLQVNTSFEESKFGIAPEKAIAFAKEVSGFDTLKIKGLMTIGLFSAEQEKVRKCFRLLNNLKYEIVEMNLPNTEMDILSMGMSGDLEAAIEEGSTMVRVGSAVFGQRKYPDSYYWDESNKA